MFGQEGGGWVREMKVLTIKAPGTTISSRPSLKARSSRTTRSTGVTTSSRVRRKPGRVSGKGAEASWTRESWSPGGQRGLPAPRELAVPPPSRRRAKHRRAAL